MWRQSYLWSIHIFCRTERKKRRQEEKTTRKTSSDQSRKISKVSTPSATSSISEIDNQQHSPLVQSPPSRKLSNSSFSIENLLQIPNISERSIPNARSPYVSKRLSANNLLWPSLVSSMHPITQPMGFIVPQQTHSRSPKIKLEERSPICPSSSALAEVKHVETISTTTNCPVDSKDAINVIWLISGVIDVIWSVNGVQLLIFYSLFSINFCLDFQIK